MDSSHSSQRLNFDQLADLCLSQRCFQSPALFHGVLTGQLCGNQGLSKDQWLALFTQLLGDPPPALNEEQQQLAFTLLEETQTTLGSPQLDFELMLPDELYELEERFSALIKWIQGFSKSLKAAGVEIASLSAEAQEGLQDLQAIEAGGQPPLGSSEDNEKDLTALIEFVRMLAMMIYLEMHPGRPQVQGLETPPRYH